MAVYMRTEVLSFRSSATHEALAEALDEQRMRGDFCDIRFIVHGETVRAHRAVLSARSPYFHTMFTSNFQEMDQGDIDMTHIFSAPQHFQEILRYMYRGSISISGDTFEEILNGASHFLMDKLRQICAQYMLTNLGPRNCMRMWAIADRYNLDHLTTVCKAMAKGRFHDCIRFKHETLEIPPEFLKVIIKEGVLDLLTVEDKLRFLRQWLDYGVKERECVFKEVLQELLGRKCDTNLRLNQLCLNITQKSYLNVLKMVDYTLSGLQIKTPVSYPVVGLVGTLKEKRPQTGTFINKLLAYIPDFRRWVILGQFEHDHTIVCKQLVGIVRHFAVFKGGDSERVVLVDLLRGNCEELPDVPWGSINRIGPLPQFFCFDETIFCVVDWGNTCSLKKTCSSSGSDRITGSKPPLAPHQQHQHQHQHSQQQQHQHQQQHQEQQQGNNTQHQAAETSKDNSKNNFFVYRRLFKLDITSRAWSEVCDLPLGNGSDLHLMRYQQRQQAGKVFVWAGQRKAAAQGSTVSPGWMCLVKEGCRYKVHPLAAPETDPLNGRAVTLSGSGATIIVNSMASVTTQRVYDIKEDRWRMQAKEKYVKPPSLQPLPLENYAVTTAEMPGLSSYLAIEHLYSMDISCTCISRLMAYNLVGEDRTWTELPPPPTERVTKYSACYLSAVVMLNAKPALYLDEALEDGQGPMYQYTLEGVEGCPSGQDLRAPHHLTPGADPGGNSSSNNGFSSSSGDNSPRQEDSSRLSPGGSRHGSVSPNNGNGFSFHFY